jgi:hypothetical protein
MPYKVKGKQVLHFKHGKWSIKQTAHSHDNAIKTMHLLYGIESGWKPTGDKTSKNYGTGERVDNYRGRGGLFDIMPKKKLKKMLR